LELEETKTLELDDPCTLELLEESPASVVVELLDDKETEVSFSLEQDSAGESSMPVR
jgi:hypothetical protein